MRWYPYLVMWRSIRVEVGARGVGLRTRAAERPKAVSSTSWLGQGPVWAGWWRVGWEGAGQEASEVRDPHSVMLVQEGGQRQVIIGWTGKGSCTYAITNANTSWGQVSRPTTSGQFHLGMALT